MSPLCKVFLRCIVAEIANLASCAWCKQRADFPSLAWHGHGCSHWPMNGPARTHSCAFWMGFMATVVDLHKGAKDRRDEVIKRRAGLGRADPFSAGAGPSRPLKGKNGRVINERQRARRRDKKSGVHDGQRYGPRPQCLAHVRLFSRALCRVHRRGYLPVGKRAHLSRPDVELIVP